MDGTGPCLQGRDGDGSWKIPISPPESAPPAFKKFCHNFHIFAIEKKKLQI